MWSGDCLQRRYRTSQSCLLGHRCCIKTVSTMSTEGKNYSVLGKLNERMNSFLGGYVKKKKPCPVGAEYVNHTLSATRPQSHSLMRGWRLPTTLNLYVWTQRYTHSFCSSDLLSLRLPEGLLTDQPSLLWARHLFLWGMALIKTLQLKKLSYSAWLVCVCVCVCASSVWGWGMLPVSTALGLTLLPPCKSCLWQSNNTIKSDWRHSHTKRELICWRCVCVCVSACVKAHISEYLHLLCVFVPVYLMCVCVFACDRGYSSERDELMRVGPTEGLVSVWACGPFQIQG